MKRFDLDFDQLKELIELLKTSGIHEIELEQDDLSVRLCASAPVAAAQHVVSAPVAAPVVNPQLPAAATEAPKKGAAFDGKVVKSPMVGTFYRSSSPESDPFVKPGDRVRKGQTLCIIEAMKTMNQIEAEHDGIVKQILVENAVPVEFGEPLFVIEG